MSYTVDPRDFREVSLNEGDIVKSVLQNVAIILSTRQGSVPMYREFGLPMRFIDKPVNVGRIMMVAEVEDAIRRFEPRAKVVGVSAVMDAGSPGRVVSVVEVEIDEES